MTYPGAKRGAGVPEAILGNIPYHTGYYEFFAGTGHIGLLKQPAKFNWFNDINEKQVKYLKGKNRPNTAVTQVPAMTLLQKQGWTRLDFIYLDPPYIAESRRSNRRLYKYEMMDEESHELLLKSIRCIDANIMISTKRSALYDRLLHDWRKIEIRTIDRTGKVYYEVIYMNYPDGLPLHQYDYIGKNKIKRYANKRIARNMTAKLSRMSPHLRQSCIRDIIAGNRDLASHFLSTLQPPAESTKSVTRSRHQKK